jgi:hypothetical protein
MFHVSNDGKQMLSLQNQEVRKDIVPASDPIRVFGCITFQA